MSFYTENKTLYITQCEFLAQQQQQLYSFIHSFWYIATVAFL